MRYYPAFLDLRGRPCLVIGGGAVAERKVLSLLAAGAAVTVVSPDLTPRLQDLSRSRSLTHIASRFIMQHLEGRILVIAATDDPAVNSAAAAACRERNILVNVAVPPDSGTFIVPSVVERGELLIAVSTSGASPALAKRVRRDLEERFGPEYGDFLAAFSVLRERLLAAVPDEDERKRIFQSIVDSDVLELFRQGRRQEAESRMASLADIPQQQ